MYENYGWKYFLTTFLAVGAILAWWANGIPTGLDLSGGDEIIYRLDFGSKTPTVKTTDTVVDVIRRRIDSLGIKELSIARLGNYSFVVQIPNASEPEVRKVRKQIERAGQLYFKLLADPKKLGLQPEDVQREISRIEQDKRNGTWKETDRYDIASWAEGGRGTPGSYELLENCTPLGKPIYVEGDLLADAYKAPDGMGRPAVGFTWNTLGSKQFYELTYNNKQRNLAVVLDGELRSAPTIQAAIGKRGIIEGGQDGWKSKELTSLIITLKSGSLPAKPVFSYRKHVGAQLGQAAVKIGKWSIGGALVVIILFMVYYYRLRSGIIADIALVLNLVLILGTLALFQATLTLPGIAGILLTAGMAVDANILIYERIREEIARGSAIRQAIQAGYDRAFWTIFDANLTTALTAIILMQVGTGPIKGFGLTLTVGIISSMFTALFVTKALYGFFVAKGFLTELSFRQLFKRPNFDFIGGWNKALFLSFSLIVVGWLVFVFRGDEKYGLDFTGGTSIQMRLRQPLAKTELLSRIAKRFEASGISTQKLQLDVQRVGENVNEGGEETSREWLIRTRLVGGAAANKEDQSRSDYSLLQVALAQDGEDPDETPALAEPVPEGDDTATDDMDGDETGDQDADDAGDGDADVSPVDSATPTPTQPEAVALDLEAEEEKGKGDQDFFEAEIRQTFEKDLVQAYPGKPEAKVLGAQQAEVSFQFNVVELLENAMAETQPVMEFVKKDGSTVEGRAEEQYEDPTTKKSMLKIKDLAGQEILLEAAEIQERRKVYPAKLARVIPVLLLERRTDLENRGKEPDVVKVLTQIIGPEGQPTVKVASVEDTDAGEGLLSFRVTFITPPDKQSQQQGVEEVRQALEKARDKGELFTPAHPFPAIDQIGSAVAKNLKSKAIVATFFSVICICLYVWLRFDFWSGIAAIVAVFHDVLALVGFLSILDLVLMSAGINYDVKFSLVTISAFLTLVGYSINDTIVILDRIREDKHLAKTKDYTAELINGAINKTLMRTVLTSLTSFLVCAVLFGGSFAGLTAIQGLSVALLFGVAVGTYSSVFIAAPILLSNKKKVVAVAAAVLVFLIVSGIASVLMAPPAA